MTIVRNTFLRLILGTACAAAVATSHAEDEFRTVGIGVADLAAAERFYVAALGMRLVRRYEFPHLHELVLALPNGDTVLLMHWPNEQREYAGGNVKLVFNVDDPAAAIERIRAAGGTIDREASHYPGTDFIVGLARDPDGYVIEVVKPAP